MAGADTVARPDEAPAEAAASEARPPDGAVGDARPSRPRRAMVVVWGPPNKGPRSAALARELGIGPATFIEAGSGRGFLSAVARYPRQLVGTLAALVGRRPRAVVVQHPPSPAVWVVALYAALTGGRFVIDAHSDALGRARWLRPLWLTRLLVRRAAAVLVTDPHWAATVEGWGARAIVNPDVPTSFELDPAASPSSPDLGFSIAVVNTWAPDEPLAAVIEAARDLPDVIFRITGRADRRVDALGTLPPNVRFTDFLAEPAYYGLLASSSAVMCLTTRDHTMQRGACEALSLGRPIITSDFPLLRGYFDRGAVHVAATPASIREGVKSLRADYDRQLAAVTDLREVRRLEWADRRETIVALLDGASTQLMTTSGASVADTPPATAASGSAGANGGHR